MISIATIICNSADGGTGRRGHGELESDVSEKDEAVQETNSLPQEYDSDEDEDVKEVHRTPVMNTSLNAAFTSQGKYGS